MEKIAEQLHDDRLARRRSDNHVEENPAIEDALEHVQLVRNLARVDFVEELAHNKGVEDERIDLLLLIFVEVFVRVVAGAVEALHRHERVARFDALSAHNVRIALGKAVERQRHRVVDRGDAAYKFILAREIVADAEVGQGVDEEKDDDELVDALDDDVLPHLGRDERLVAAVGLLAKEAVVGILRGERERRHGVHDEVDPQELQDIERGPGAVREAADDGGHEGDSERDEVDGDLELQKLADVVENGAAPEHGADDGGEAVVEDDDVGRLLGHLCAGEAHREADVRFGEGRRVVRAVAGDSHHLAQVFERAHELVLVLRRRAGEHLQLREHLVELRLVAEHGAERRALHSDAVRENPALGGDVLGGEDVVARHHAHDDAGVLARLDGFRHVAAQRVFDADDGDARHVALRRLVEKLIADGGERRRLKVAHREADAAQTAARHVLDHALELRLFARGHRVDDALLVHDARALLQHELRGALAVERFARRVGHEHGSHLAVGRKGVNLLHELVAAQLLVPRNVGNRLELFLEHEERALGAVADETDAAILLGDEERLAVERDAAREAVHHGRRERGRHRGFLLAREPPLHHRHAVFREGARLVAADLRGSPHRLARRQKADEVVVAHHLFHGVRQRDGHRERQPLRHRHDDDGHR
mmetsp:Transcript_8941/g.29391  ORF Transcript_8941/g.29391 Transcript_8941/m.29391 type:complete len:654 (-) Transcript_8941:1542-3503(-)